MKNKLIRMSATFAGVISLAVAVGAGVKWS
jgi:hypothetical protein